ncbi:ComF family protein [Kiloniella sp.]|uniref:ComF family protein n=1 Tax=Kiloniella sp. TaxID=1938587 RepID=UPI003B014CDE
MVDIPFFFSNLWAGAIDYVLPPVCGGCGEPVIDNAGICGTCWADLTFISAPCCSCCGYPFELSAGDEALCGECLRVPKSFDRCRSAISYDDHSRDMIIGYKHADRTHLGQLFSTWLALVGKEIIQETDFIVPVPLHPKRLFLRRYNQSALLAQRIAKEYGRKYLPDLLIRVKNTSSQGHLSKTGRWENVRSAFQINPKYNEIIVGEKITLIDDVYTTGATLEACSRTLQKVNVARVDALVVARVLARVPT